MRDLKTGLIAIAAGRSGETEDVTKAETSVRLTDGGDIERRRGI